MADYLLAVSSGDNFFRAILALVIFVGILAATYYITKWVAGYQKVKMTNHNFEIVDTMRISANKYIMIIRMGRNRYFSIGVGKDEFTFFGELSGEEIIHQATTAADTMPMVHDRFKELFDSFLDHKETSEHHEEEP